MYGSLKKEVGPFWAPMILERGNRSLEKRIKFATYYLSHWFWVEFTTLIGIRFKEVRIKKCLKTYCSYFIKYSYGSNSE